MIDVARLTARHLDLDREECWLRSIAAEQQAEAEADAADAADLWAAAVAEAERRRCDPDELIAAWQDNANEPADFDDHDTEHDPRDCQTILGELGMREVPLGYLSRCNPPTPYTERS